MNRKSTIDKHGEVVEKPLYKCISEGLTHVTAWCHGTPRPLHEIRGISFDWQDPQRCQISSRSDQTCVRYPVWKNFTPQKNRPKFTLGHLIITLLLISFFTDFTIITASYFQLCILLLHILVHELDTQFFHIGTTWSGKCYL